MKYSKFIDQLKSYAEESYAAFHRSLTPTKYTILGVRVPIMRKIAKGFSSQPQIYELLSYPNEYYEVVFIKLAAVSALPYEEFIKYVNDCVELMDNWAHCDSFKANCIEKNRDNFLPYLENIFQQGSEFHQRYALVTLLYYYINQAYYPLLVECIQKSNMQLYYVHMAVAWLVAEILVKDYEYGVTLLNQGILPPKTHNKCIQKAIESYRLSEKQKEQLRSLKIKL